MVQYNPLNGANGLRVTNTLAADRYATISFSWETEAKQAAKEAEPPILRLGRSSRSEELPPGTPSLFVFGTYN